MRDSKSLLLISISLLLFVISFVILCSWGYNFYYKIKDDKQSYVTTVPNNKADIPVYTGDSLKKEYAAAVKTLDTMLNSTLKDADSMTGNLNVRLDEFTTLRNEIVDILKSPTGDPDLQLARTKIKELQERITSLRNRNSDVEEENRKLYSVLNKLTSTKPASQESIGKPVVFENPPVQENKKVVNLSVLELHLSALQENGGENQETFESREAEKFSGTLTVKNNGPSTNSEMYLVLVQPDGRVLNSGWESGTFSTSRGKKNYSSKVHFECSKGESRKVNFSLDADKIQKGKYTLQLYNNGELIAKTSQTLN